MTGLIPIVIPMEIAISPVEIPMEVDVTSVEVQMEVALSYQMVPGEFYEGETEVRSLLNDTYYLETQDKIMPENVTVLPIEIVETDNDAGGRTVTIGTVRS